MDASKREMLAFPALTVTFAKTGMHFREAAATLCWNLMQADTIQSAKRLFTNHSLQRKRPFQIAAILTPRLRQHQGLPTSGSSCPQCFPLITIYKFTSLLLHVWFMLVIMTILLFTQHIYPGLLPVICWLTSSTFYWWSLMGQLKGVLTALWNITALSLLLVCEIGAKRKKSSAPGQRP